MTNENQGIVLTDDAEAVLASVYENGGVATTSEIKRDTGLDTDTIRYRVERSRDALTDAGLVDIESTPREAYDGPGLPPKRVELTERAVDEIEDGLLGGDVFESGVSDEVSVSREQFREFQNELQTLENKVSALAEESREDRVEDEIEEIRRDLDEYERLFAALFEALLDEGIDAREYVNR